MSNSTTTMSAYIDPQDIVLNYTVNGYPLEVTFGQLELSSQTFMNFAIIHGVAVGVGFLLLVLSWAIVINKKTPIFIMNQVSLLLLVLRSALYLAYLEGPLTKLSYIYTGIFTGSWNAYYVTLAANILFCFLVASVETTMVFQVYVMFKPSKQKFWGMALAALCGALGVAVVVLYINSSVHVTKVLKAQLSNKEFSQYASWVGNLPIIMFSCTVNLLSVILVLKLAVAVRTRWTLGLKQFDSFHILIIMISQTFIIPSALVIANYANPSSNFLSSLSFIIAVFNLPLGSLWASSSNSGSHPTSTANTVLQRVDTSASSQDTLATKEKYLGKFITPPVTDLEKGSGLTTHFEGQDSESLEEIFQSFEDRGKVSVSTSGYR